MNNNGKLKEFLCAESPGKNFSNFNIEACRICLATDTRLYRMQEHSLQTIYEQLTGLSMTPTDRLPEHLCWECAHRLVCCQSLRNKALRSHTLMMDILTTAGELTTTSMRRVDRQSNDLCSTLSQRDTVYITYELQLYEVDNNDAKICVKEDVIEEVHDISQEDKSFQKANENYQNSDANFEEAHDPLKTIKTEKEFKFKKEETDSMNDAEDDFLMGDNATSSSNVVSSKPKEQVKDTKVKRKRSKNDGCKPKVIKRNKAFGKSLNTKLFKIANLTFDEQISAMKKREESVKYKNSPYKCSDCYKGFRSEDLYKDHMILHTDRIGPYVCKICKVHWKTVHKQRQHEQMHSTRISCNQCTFVTASQNSAKYHEEYHNGTLYQCPHCELKFTKCTTYKNHVRRRHPSFLCGLCGMSFVGARGLDLHMKRMHRFYDRTTSEEGPYCDTCEIRFSSQDAFDTHLQLSARHKTKRIQGMVLLSKRRRRRPKAEGTPAGPPVPCEQCDMQLPDYKSYHFHFARAHPEKNRTRFSRASSRFMCEVCGKLYLSMASLQDHSTMHSESKQFKCDQCQKTFHRKYRLFVHLRNHAMKPPTHPCDECGKRFSTLRNMMRHRLIHTGVKSHECDVCGKRFLQASERQSHMAHVHLGEPWPKRSRGKRQRPQPTSAAGRKATKSDDSG